MGASAGPDAITDDLILYLDAANPQSYSGTGNTWFDLSKSKNNGTLVNGVAYDSSNGGSLIFDGSNDYVSLASIPQIAQSTYSSTVEVTAIRERARFEVMFGGGVPTSHQGFYVGFRSSNTSNFMYAYYSNDQDSSTPVTNLQWNHYVATYDHTIGSRYRYFNGEILLPKQDSGVRSTSASSFSIGAFNGSLYFFDGKIQSVKVYNRSISAEEAKQNFQATRSRYGV